MRMRRTMANLCTVLVILLLSACSMSRSELASEKKTAKELPNKKLSVAVFDNGNGSKEKYWRTVIQKFEKEYPGVTIQLQSNPKILELITPQMITGHPPDLIVIAPNSGRILEEMTKEKKFLDLTALFENNAAGMNEPLKNRLIEGILNNTKPLGDGKIYYAPFTTSSMGLIYNKSLFKSKGWNLPKTWDEFLALGEVAKQDGRSLFTYQGLYPGYVESLFWPSVASAGGIESVLKAANFEKDAFKSSAVQKAMNVFDNIARNGYLLSGSVTMNHIQSQAAFLQGKALFVPCGSWIEDEMKDAQREKDFEYGFLPPPVFKEGQQQYTEVWLDGMYIPVKAENIELAKAFLTYQYRDDNVKLNAEITKGIVAVKNGAELAKPYLSPVFYDAAKIFENGVKPIIFQWKMTPSTDIHINNELWIPIGSIMNRMMTVSQWQDQVEVATAKLRELENTSK